MYSVLTQIASIAATALLLLACGGKENNSFKSADTQTQNISVIQGFSLDGSWKSSCLKQTQNNKAFYVQTTIKIQQKNMQTTNEYFSDAQCSLAFPNTVQSLQSTLVIGSESKIIPGGYDVDVSTGGKTQYLVWKLVGDTLNVADLENLEPEHDGTTAKKRTNKLSKTFIYQRVM